MTFLSLALLIALACTESEAMQVSDMCHKVQLMMSQVSNMFGSTFQQLGTTALSTGSELLTRALGAGSQLLTADAAQLGLGVQHSPALAQTKRDMSAIVEEKDKDVLNSFATDLKDKLHGEFEAAVRELQTLAFKSLILSHDQFKQKVNQTVSSHSHQMTALLDSLPEDLIKFVEKVLVSRSGLLDEIRGSLVHTASQLTQQFKPHVQNVQQLLGNLGETLTTFVDALSTMTNIHHSIHLSSAIQTATSFLRPEQLIQGVSAGEQ